MRRGNQSRPRSRNLSKSRSRSRSSRRHSRNRERCPRQSRVQCVRRRVTSGARVVRHSLRSRNPARACGTHSGVRNAPRNPRTQSMCAPSAASAELAPRGLALSALDFGAHDGAASAGPPQSSGRTSSRGAAAAESQTSDLGFQEKVTRTGSGVAHAPIALQSRCLLALVAVSVDGQGHRLRLRE